MWATFDYALHSAGRFQDIRALWVELVLVVSDGGEQVRTFTNGHVVEDRCAQEQLRRAPFYPRRIPAARVVLNRERLPSENWG